MAAHCECEDQTVLVTQGGDGEEVSSCRCTPFYGRTGFLVGVGLVAAAAGGAYVYYRKQTSVRLDEQVKATLPLQT